MSKAQSSVLIGTAQYRHLNRAVPPNSGYSEAWVRVLERLGEYTAVIARSHNLRPQHVSVYRESRSMVLVRLSLAQHHVILRIAPEAQLTPLLWFARTAQQRGIPVIQIYEANLRRTLVPFEYLLEQYIGGSNATHLEPTQQHSVARHAGRVLRRLHAIPAPGWGNPTVHARWLIEDWSQVLLDLHQRYAHPASAQVLYTAEQQVMVAQVLHDPRLTQDVTPHLIHTALLPQRVRCTAGDTARLEVILHAGELVAGDPMLDLALALRPDTPAAWQQGLLAGYVASGALSPAVWHRLPLLRLLCAYWYSLYCHARAWPHAAAHTAALDHLEQVAGRMC